MRRGVCVGGVSPCPVGFKEGRVVDDGGEQGREAPQQQGGEELGDDGVLQRGAECVRWGQSSGPSLLCLPAPSPSEPWAPQLSGPHVRSPEHLGARAICTIPA